MEANLKKGKNERSSADDSDSDSDDELLQKALARRILSESTHREVDLEEVDNSDMEDVVSVSRRLRHIYKMLEKQNKLIDQQSRAIEEQDKIIADLRRAIEDGDKAIASLQRVVNDLSA